MYGRESMWKVGLVLSSGGKGLIGIGQVPPYSNFCPDDVGMLRGQTKGPQPCTRYLLRQSAAGRLF